MAHKKVHRHLVRFFSFCFPLNLHISLQNRAEAYFLMRTLPKLTYMLAPDPSEGVLALGGLQISKPRFDFDFDFPPFEGRGVA